MRNTSIGILVFAVTGCGTFANLSGFGIFAGHHLEPYGGVKICVEGGLEKFRTGWPIGGAYLLCVDLPFSAVADTLTLPTTIRALQDGETNKHLVEQNAEASDKRDFVEDAPMSGHLVPVKVHGGLGQ